MKRNIDVAFQKGIEKWVLFSGVLSSVGGGPGWKSYKGFCYFGLFSPAWHWPLGHLILESSCLTFWKAEFLPRLFHRYLTQCVLICGRVLRMLGTWGQPGVCVVLTLYQAPNCPIARNQVLISRGDLASSLWC